MNLYVTCIKTIKTKGFPKGTNFRTNDEKNMLSFKLEHENQKQTNT
jgi:hypothetical protein